MRCLHLLDTDAFAGTERHVLLLVQCLRALGEEAEVGCCEGSALQKSAVDQQIPTVVLGRQTGPRMLRQLLRVVQRGRPDLIHAHNGRTQLMGAVTNAITKVPLFATQHFITPQFATYSGPKRWLASRAHAWVNRHVTTFAAVSEAARSAMLKRETLPPERVVAIPNGVAPIVAPRPERVREIRAELKVEPGGTLAVALARLVPEKGIADLLHAVALVRRAVGNIVFAIVGEGPLAASLATLATQLGIKSSVRFTGFREDATDLIAAANLFVLPSPAEPFGLVLLEAMALGKPVIAIAAGGPLEIVIDGETGRLVPPGDTAKLATAILEMSSSPSLGRMGAAGKERFEQHFTANRMAACTRAMYAAGLGLSKWEKLAAGGAP